ncbi:MAG: penicillin-binding protein [Spirochaetaceae bacterium]
MTESGPNRRRLKAFFILLALLTTVVVYRYGAIMLDTPTSQGSSEAEADAGRAERGPILDRNGRVLAVQTDLDTVTVWTPHVDDPAGVAAELSRILDTDEDELRERIQSASGYLVVRRTISPSQSEAVEAAMDEGELPGVRLEPDVGRSYPERELASHVLGYVGRGNRGLEGIEHSMNEHLQPASEDAEYGNQVFLTIDVNIQHELERLAREARDRHEANSVMLLAMDADSGEVLGYASRPGFDPNRYQEYTSEERRNRPISYVYEPGSVFKIFSVASFLELGGVEPDDTFNTSGGYHDRRADFRIHDLGDYGEISTAGILKYSSNVGAAYASETVNEDSFYHMVKLFGFGEETGIEFSGEGRALLRRPSQWSGRTKATIAIGQEIGVTAMQMVTAATALANDGILLRPHVVRKIVSPGGKVLESFGREPVREVISPATARAIRGAMQEATEPDGTARRIRVDGVDIAAKTGTAEIFDLGFGSYSADRFVASTLAMFPAEAPEVILYLVIDQPQEGEFFGGRIAAPVAREAVEYLVEYLGIPTGTDDIVEHDGTVRVSRPELPEFDETVPDLTGLPKRTLLPLLAEEDLRVRIEGNGWVVRQSPAPGTPIEPGMQVEVELE